MNKPDYVCTMGRSLYDINVLRELYENGMSTVRFNMTHTFYDIDEIIEKLNYLETRYGYHISKLMDTHGPKLSVIHRHQRPIEAYENKIIILGRDIDLTCNYSERLEIGDKISIHDGEVNLVVIKIEGNLVYCESMDQGIIRDGHGAVCHKLNGILPFMSVRDEKDIRRAFQENYEELALSFVRKPEDVEIVKQIKGEYNTDTAIISKIETCDAVKDLAPIIDASDGIMIARGDLSVEMPIEELAYWQEVITTETLKRGKRLISGTGYLSSMRNNNNPTKSEVTDLYNTFQSGINTIMFSGEINSAKKPVMLLKTANKIYETTKR